MGKTLLSESKKAMLGGRDISGILFRQLSAAVASNSLDVSQARSVAYAITEELGRQDVGMNVNAQLTAMFGPNGENLLKDPLKIQIQQIDQTGSGLAEDFSVLQDDLNVTFDEYLTNLDTFQKDTKESMGGWADFGTAVDKGISGPLGMITSFLTGGKITGIFQGITSGIGGLVKGAEGEVTAMNSYVVNVANAIENYQSSIDSLDAYYQKAIEAAKAAGDLAKASELQTKYDTQRNILMERYGSAMADIVKAFNTLDSGQQGKLITASEDRLKEKFKDDADSLAIYNQAATNVKKLTGDNQYQLNMLLNADAMTLSTFSWISSNLTNDQVTKVMNLRTVLSGKDLGTMTSLLSRFSKTGQANFIATFSAKDMTSKTAKELLSTFTEINNLADTIGTKNGQELMDFYANPQNVGKLKSLGKAIKDLKKFDGDKLTVSYIQNIEGGDKFAEVIKGNQAYFDGLDKNQQITYTQIVATMVLGDQKDLEADALAWATQKGMFGGYNPGQLNQDQKNSFTKKYINEMAQQRTEFLKAMGMLEDASTTPDTTGGSKTDPLADLLKKLQNIRLAAVDAAGGITELFKRMKPGALEKKGGGLIFNGIDQQLSKKNLNKDFIDYITNADKSTQKLFIKIKNGVVSLKPEGIALQNLFNNLTIGNYERSVAAAVRATQQELAARKDLLATGMSYQDAVEAGKDSGLAESIAAIKASSSIIDKNKAIAETIDLYKKQKAAAESVKTSEEKFNELFDKIGKKFDADKQKINLDFEISISGEKAAVAKAQQEIEDIRFKLDDLNAGITVIGWAEEEINKKYDARKEALDKVRELNDKIAAQQKDQLSLASALSSGDMAAAARAAQEMRSNAAGRGLDDMTKQLDLAKQAELDGLTANINGKKMTRKEIEKQIKDLEKEIFNIEESRLEPAQNAIRKAEELRDIKLTALDNEKTKWEQLQSKIALANTAAIDYAKSLKEANALAAGAVLDITTKPTGPANYNTGPTGSTGSVKNTGPTKPKATGPTQPKNTGPTGSTGSTGPKVGDKKYVGSQMLTYTKQLVKGTGVYNGSQFVPAKYEYIWKSNGGIIPQYFGNGGEPRGTDTVPAMLTPGEFVMQRAAVSKYGIGLMDSINNGALSMPEYSVAGSSGVAEISSAVGNYSNIDNSSVYNSYTINVTGGNNANPNEVARLVIDKIKSIDNQRVKGNRIR